MFDDLTTGSPTPVCVRWVRTPSRRAPESSGWWWGSPPPAERLVTLSNWQEPPWNRWAFQHVGQLIPSARISRGDGPILELPPPRSRRGARGHGPTGAGRTADRLRARAPRLLLRGRTTVAPT